MHDRIPVTLLTGFLGAGKTTVLNKLLHDPSAGRIAVIVNEFGDAGLDHDLIEDTAEDVVLMAGGCVCCTIRGDLSRTLQSLAERRTAGTLEFDRVVLETTGLADPSPVHHTLLIERELASQFVLDGIVTLVDTVLGANTLDRHEEAQSQVAMADKIVLTKNDLATPTSKSTVLAKLDRLNPRAPRLEAEMGQLPSGVLFGLSASSRAASHSETLTWLSAMPAPDPVDPFAGLSGFKQAQPTQVLELTTPSHHASDERITSASVTIEMPIPAGVFDVWLDTLIELRGANVLRLKGVVHIEGVVEPFVFHGVQHIFEPPRPLKDWPKGDTTSRVVIIARDFPQAELDQCLTLLHTQEAQDGLGDGITVHTLAFDDTVST